MTSVLKYQHIQQITQQSFGVGCNRRMTNEIGKRFQLPAISHTFLIDKLCLDFVATTTLQCAHETLLLFDLDNDPIDKIFNQRICALFSLSFCLQVHLGKENESRCNAFEKKKTTKSTNKKRMKSSRE